MNNQDYHVHHGQTFLTLQESLLTSFQLIRKDIVDPPRIQGYPSSKPSVSGSYLGGGEEGRNEILGIWKTLRLKILGFKKSGI